MNVSRAGKLQDKLVFNIYLITYFPVNYLFVCDKIVIILPRDMSDDCETAIAETGKERNLTKLFTF